METIRQEEALKIIDSGQVVNITYAKYDHARKQGGQLRTIRAVVCTPKIERTSAPSDPQVKSQNHFQFFTRNFFVCINDRPTSAVRKVHMNMLLELDGKRVML